MLTILERKRHLFDEVVNIRCANGTEIDTKTNRLAELIYDSCFSVFGKTVTSNKQKLPDVHKKAPWFDEECRVTKAAFLKFKFFQIQNFIWLLNILTCLWPYIYTSK